MAGDLDPRLLHDKLHCMLVNTDLDYGSIDALHGLIDTISRQHRDALSAERAAHARRIAELEQDASNFRAQLEESRRAEAAAVSALHKTERKQEAKQADYNEQLKLMRSLSHELVRSQEQAEQQIRLEYEHRIAEIGRDRLTTERPKPPPQSEKKARKASTWMSLSNTSSVTRDSSDASQSTSGPPSGTPSGASSHTGIVAD
jgi:chromosome segregation ATPase